MIAKNASARLVALTIGRRCRTSKARRPTRIDPMPFRYSVRLLPLLAALVCGPAPVASAQGAPRDAKRPPVQALSCAGAFARNATHAGIVKAFGAGNVTAQKVHIGEGETAIATVVFARDKARRIEILWRDAKRRRNLAEIRISRGSGWRTAQGVATGMSLAEVQAINGRPFRLYGFGWDYAGTTYEWDGGALDAPSGDCVLQLRFEMTRRTDADIVGERGFLSDDEGMRSAAPVVEDISLKVSD